MIFWFIAAYIIWTILGVCYFLANMGRKDNPSGLRYYLEALLIGPLLPYAYILGLIGLVIEKFRT